MPAATPLGLRQRILDLHQQGLPSPQIAQVVPVPERTIRDLLGQWRQQPPGSDLAPHFARLCLRVAEEDRIQREVYPAIDGRSRTEAYPSLLSSGRGYSRGWEKYGWGLQAALSLLGGYQVRRKVSKRGQVTLYNRKLHVGETYAGSEVDVRLDAPVVQWVATDLRGQEIRRVGAVEITEESVRGLSLTKRWTDRSAQRAARRAGQGAAGGQSQ
jgi:hypothetical protein